MHGELRDPLRDAPPQVLAVGCRAAILEERVGSPDPVRAASGRVARSATTPILQAATTQAAMPAQPGTERAIA